MKVGVARGYGPVQIRTLETMTSALDSSGDRAYIVCHLRKELDQHDTIFEATYAAWSPDDEVMVFYQTENW